MAIFEKSKPVRRTGRKVRSIYRPGWTERGPLLVNNTTKIIVTSAFSLALIYLHYTSDPSDIDLHNFYFHLNYLPIILAGIWFGFKGAVLFAILFSAAFLPHLFLQHHADPIANMDMFLELALYIVVGMATGLLSSSERNQRGKYQRTAEELEASLKALRENQKQLLRAERLSALGQMAAGLAHELRNPLQSIKVASEILAEVSSKDTGRKGHQAAEVVRGEIARLEALVNHFLLFARPKEPTLIEADINYLVKKTVRIVKLKTNGVRATVSTSLDENLPPCRFDPEQIEQVLLNLILNALDAVGEDGRIKIITRHDRAHLIVEVVDNGPGIPEEDMEKVFAPFFSGKGGTGLGLSIAEKIVKAHGGRISVRNNEEGGCRFSVYLPVMEED